MCTLTLHAPACRYLKLLQQGAEHWQLHPQYVAWLNGLRSIDSEARGSEYYSCPAGQKLEAWPKIRTGSEGSKGGRGGGRVRRGRGGGGGRGGDRVTQQQIG